MRTTVAIDDELLHSARLQARRRGLTLGQLFEEALLKELSQKHAPPPGPPIPVFSGGGGVRPGVDLSSTRALLEALDEGRELDKRR